MNEVMPYPKKSPSGVQSWKRVMLSDFTCWDPYVSAHQGEKIVMATWPNPAKNRQTKASQYVDVIAKNRRHIAHIMRLIDKIIRLCLEFEKIQVPNNDPIINPV